MARPVAACLLVISACGLLALQVMDATATHDDQDPPAPYPFDTWPSWSPDGSRIAFSSDRGPGHAMNLYELGLADGRIRPLLPWLPGAENPAYSPDGGRLLFSLGAVTHVMDLTTGKVVPLQTSTDPGDVGFYPSFRTSSEVLFMKTPRGAAHNCIHRIALGPNLERLRREVLFRDSADLTLTAATGDGTRVAYAKVVDSALRGGRTDICVWDERTGQSQVAFVATNALERLSWSPDGKRLLVSALAASADQPAQYIVHVDERRMERLQFPAPMARRISGRMDVSPDGGWFCYTADSSRGFGVTLWRCRADGSGAEELTHEPAWYYERFPDQQPVGGCDQVFGDPTFDPLASRRAGREDSHPGGMRPPPHLR